MGWNSEEWSKFIEMFNSIYEGKPTRLGVFEKEDGRTIDYWIESGLPLSGVNVEDSSPLPAFRVDMGNYSHEIKNVMKASINLTASRDEDGIDFLDDSGRMTILRMDVSTSSDLTSAKLPTV